MRQAVVSLQGRRVGGIEKDESGVPLCRILVGAAAIRDAVQLAA